MNNNIILRTGNPIVDEIATLNITGNVIPQAWYYTIVNEKGKVNYLAINILADIVYWYRPTEHRDETTLSVSYTKKFQDTDYLQRSYDQLMQIFNITKKQAYDAIVALEKLGVIKRHFRTIYTTSIPIANVMFIELIPEVLKELTYPGFNKGVYKNVGTPLQKDKEVVTKTEPPYSENIETYTENTSESTSENTTKTSTTSSVVVEAKRLFNNLGLSESDILSIVKASDNNITKCQTAKKLLAQQTTKINNIVGWLIQAVKNNYQAVSQSPPAAKNSFHNFQQREYDFDALEHLLLNE